MISTRISKSEVFQRITKIMAALAVLMGLNSKIRMVMCSVTQMVNYPNSTPKAEGKILMN